MFMNRTFLFRSTILAAVCLFAACGPGAKEDPNENTAAADTTEQEQQDTSSAPEYTLPSPLRIASIFKKSGLKYVEGITNSPSNVTKYTTNTSKALALGIYSSDLCYNVLNKQSQNARNYLKATKQLGSELGMESVFGANSLNERFEKNIEKEDSLPLLIAELQMETDTYLEDNEKEHISAIVFAGAWVESMYIGSKVYEKSKDAKLSTQIAEQMTILDNIINVLKQYQPRDESIGGVVTELNSIQDLYLSFESVKKATGVEDSESQITLTDEELAKLSERISQARQKFVNA